MSNELLKLIDGKAAVSVRAGRFVGLEGARFLVDMGDQRVPVSTLNGNDVPLINEAVNVLTVDGVPYVTGPVLPRSGIGVVVSVSGTDATVTTDVGDVVMKYAGSAPTSGDTVGIVWSGSPWCIELSGSPVDPDPEPDPGGESPAPVTKTVVFRATNTGTTHPSGDWWQAEVWAAVGNLGAWFYGTQVEDTIPSSATFVSLQVYVNRRQKFGDAPNWALHTLTSKTSAPTFTALDSWHPSGNGWQTPPFAEDIFDGMKQGGGFSGIGLDEGGFNKFASRAQDGLSGALRISWKG